MTKLHHVSVQGSAQVAQPAARVIGPATVEERGTVRCGLVSVAFFLIHQSWRPAQRLDAGLRRHAIAEHPETLLKRGLNTVVLLESG